MINSSKGKNVGAKKQEGETNEIKLSRTTTTSSSRQWAGFKNPRIVRVSRTFGGKDRHSKVCTIRGLRDRRIRLSVPSAIQLYHLQDRLGLNQPSKVVDWLLDVTKDDIDKLPPLQIPPGDFVTQFYQQTLSHHNELNSTLQSSFSPFFNSNSKLIKEGIRNDNNEDAHLMAIRKSNYLASLDSDSRGKHNEVERENIVYKWNSTNEQEYEGANSSGSYIPQLSAQNFLPSVDQFPFPSLINNNLSYNWEPPNLSLSQFGSQVLPSHVHSHSSATHSSSLPSLAHQVPTAPSFLPQYYAPYVPSSSAGNDHPRHDVNHFQFMSSSSSNTVPDSGMFPFRFIHPFNMNSKENMQSSGTDTTKL